MGELKFVHQNHTHTHARGVEQLMHSAPRVDEILFRPAGFHGNYSASMGLSMSSKPVTIMRGFSAPLCFPPHRGNIFEELRSNAEVGDSSLIERTSQPQELFGEIKSFNLVRLGFLLSFYAHYTAGVHS